MSWGFATCKTLRMVIYISQLNVIINKEAVTSQSTMNYSWRYLSHIFLPKSLRIYCHESRVIHLPNQSEKLRIIPLVEGRLRKQLEGLTTYNKYQERSKKVLYVDRGSRKRHHSQVLHGNYGSNKKI